MIDIVNERLIRTVAVFIHFDCREGVCGMCSMIINGVPRSQGAASACPAHVLKLLQ
jgi:succinate dehydrogenase / fumarate reductase iron-sulfur subunit